jgi:hypothetical protein
MELVIKLNNELMSRWTLSTPPASSRITVMFNPGVGSENQVITFVYDQRFGLVDTGQRDIEREYRDDEALSAVVHATSLTVPTGKWPFSRSGCTVRRTDCWLFPGAALEKMANTKILVLLIIEPHSSSPHLCHFFQIYVPPPPPPTK